MSRAQVKRAIAVAVVGVVAMAPFLGGSGNAGAATTATWNRLAGCESGGDWHINTGNGYYGGLQMTQQTWDGYGGRKYAPRADLATPEEQMDIGENILKAADYSWSAWPACSRKLGLTRQDAMETDKTVDGAFVHGYPYKPTKPPHGKPPLHRLVVN